MATGTYTLSSAQLTDFLQKWKHLERSDAYKQIVRLFMQYDAQFGTTNLNSVNGLAPHVLNMSTGVVSIDTTDVDAEHELVFFR